MTTRASGAILVLIGAGALSGCATAPSGGRYTYYRVPCETPGAVVAQPIALGQGPSTDVPQPDPSAVEPRPDAPPPSAPPATCVIAVNEASYGRGYYPWPGYRRPYYGSFGVGIGIGSLGHGYRGGHFGAGHGISHHGGHH